MSLFKTHRGNHAKAVSVLPRLLYIDASCIIERELHHSRELVGSRWRVRRREVSVRWCLNADAAYIALHGAGGCPSSGRRATPGRRGAPFPQII